MDWTQTLFLLSAILGMMYWFTSKISKDVDRIEEDVKIQGQRIDQCMIRIDQCMIRIDQLYQMFVDLLKERK